MAADIGSIAMSLRDKPTRLDWISVGLRAVAVSVRLRRNLRADRSGDPWDYFETDGLTPPWQAFPDTLGPLVLEHVRDVEVDNDYWDGSEDADLVCLGTLEGERVGWLVNGAGRLCEGPFMRSDRQDETHAALGRALWKQLGGRHVVLGTDGLAPDPMPLFGALPTCQMRSLMQRTSAFLHAGHSRSYLLAGPPGTGKSTGMRWIAGELDLQTLHVDIEVFRNKSVSNDALVSSVTTLVQALRPDALLIDDIDRVRDEDKLLNLLELANRQCKLVMASANDLSRMTRAVLRPGRFDEIIPVVRPDQAVVRAMLGADADLLDRLADLPIAFVAEFVKRRDALGREAALAELEELGKRSVVE